MIKVIINLLTIYLIYKLILFVLEKFKIFGPKVEKRQHQNFQHSFKSKNEKPRQNQDDVIEADYKVIDD